MTRIRYDFCSEVNDAVRQQLDLIHSSAHGAGVMTRINIQTCNLRNSGEIYVHAVEASKKRIHDIDGDIIFAKIRVIADVNGYEQGLTVSVPCNTKLQEKKYEDLRYLIRNRDRIMLEFKDLEISRTIKIPRGLYFTASDYRVIPANEHSNPKPSLII